MSNKITCIIKNAGNISKPKSKVLISKGYARFLYKHNKVIIVSKRSNIQNIIDKTIDTNQIKDNMVINVYRKCNKNGYLNSIISKKHVKSIISSNSSLANKNIVSISMPEYKFINTIGKYKVVISYILNSSSIKTSIQIVVSDLHKKNEVL